MNELDKFLLRVEGLLDRLDSMLPRPANAPDCGVVHALRWRRRANQAYLQPVTHPHRIQLSDLCGIDRQRKLVEDNTLQFIEGLGANNVLLTGARGTGKSSLIKALLNRYAQRGLRLIEVDKNDLVDLPDIVDLIADLPFKFILFCDDLSFDSEEPGYKALKVVLDGSIAATSDNVLVYATSNRRHLMPEFMSENLETKYRGEEIHPGESVEEKISLSERFGLWVSFYPFDQDEFVLIVNQWLRHFGVPPGAIDAARLEALQWALSRGSRSGRVAWQFARDFAGRHRVRARTSD